MGRLIACNRTFVLVCVPVNLSTYPHRWVTPVGWLKCCASAEWATTELLMEGCPNNFDNLSVSTLFGPTPRHFRLTNNKRLRHGVRSSEISQWRWLFCDRYRRWLVCHLVIRVCVCRWVSKLIGFRFYRRIFINSQLLCGDTIKCATLKIHYHYSSRVVCRENN